MPVLGRSALVPALAMLAAACSHAGSVTRVATDYNRAFADARNQQLLTNVLRASAREPLMFSAPSEVNVTVNRTIGLDTVASNLITGGRDAISPTLKLGGSIVPLVKIAPQSHKEFTEGLLQPITPERLHLFLSQGWDAEFLLPLVVEEYRCEGGKAAENSGESSELLPSRLATAGVNFDLRREVVKGASITMVVSNERALEMLGSEMAGGYKVVAIRPAGSPVPPAPGPVPALASAQVNVTLSAPDKSSWTADMGSLCNKQERQTISFASDAPAPSAGYLKLRSVEGIIYFLGEAMRPCVVRGEARCTIHYVKGEQGRLAGMSAERRAGNTHQLFRIYASDRPLADGAVAAKFHGRNFTIPRLDEGDSDRTLKTLSFLSQLIALQTSAVPLSPTIIGVPQ